MTAWTQEQLTAAAAQGFGSVLGIHFLKLEPDRVEAEIPVTRAILNDDGIVHGGALMAIADTIGGTAARINLSPGWATATSQSATHFLARATGPLLTATCVPEHRGRLLSVWNTRLFCAGRLVATVTQTQIHLAPAA